MSKIFWLPSSENGELKDTDNAKLPSLQIDSGISHEIIFEALSEYF